MAQRVNVFAMGVRAKKNRGVLVNSTNVAGQCG